MSVQLPETASVVHGADPESPGARGRPSGSVSVRVRLRLSAVASVVAEGAQEEETLPTWNARSHRMLFNFITYFGSLDSVARGRKTDGAVVRVAVQANWFRCRQP